MSDEPQINVAVPDALCPVHGEPFREDWPRGYAIAMVRLFQAFAADEDVIAFSGGEVDRLQLAFAELGPMCCRVPTAWREVVDEVFGGAEDRGRCNICGAEDVPGRPYNWTDPDGDTRRWAHLCFDCVERQVVGREQAA